MYNYRDYEKELERMKSVEATSEWGIMDAESKVFAYAKFIQDQFTARLIQDDDNFLIFDWRGKDTFNLSTRYILDKQKGSLIISGDSGDCVSDGCNPAWIGVGSGDCLVEKLNGLDVNRS